MFISPCRFGTGRQHPAEPLPYKPPLHNKAPCTAECGGAIHTLPLKHSTSQDALRSFKYCSAVCQLMLGVLCWQPPDVGLKIPLPCSFMLSSCIHPMPTQHSLSSSSSSLPCTAMHAMLPLLCPGAWDASCSIPAQGELYVSTRGTQSKGVPLSCQLA